MKRAHRLSEPQWQESPLDIVIVLLANIAVLAAICAPLFATTRGC